MSDVILRKLHNVSFRGTVINNDMAKTKRQFTAIYKKTGRWYSGWIEEIPGVNTQGKTLKETKENLREALLLILILEVNRSVYFV